MAPFDLVDLKLFVHVCESGTITAGAQAMPMALPSASERIRAMEARMRLQLLERDRRGVAPTAAGRSLLQHARQMLRQVDSLQDELNAFGAGLKGHVRLFCNTSAMSEHLPDRIGAFLLDHAGISVSLEERRSEDSVAALRDGIGDLAVISGSVDCDGLQTIRFVPDPLVLIVPQGHALDGGGRLSLSLGDAAAYPFVGMEDGSALQAHVGQFAGRQGKRLDYRIRLGSFEAVCRLVGRGVGIAIVPRVVAVRHARRTGIRHIPLSDAWARRELLFCARDFGGLPRHAQLLLAHLRQG